MAHILVVDDQDRTLELCRRVMPEHEWHGPARSWEEALSALRELGARTDLVLLDVHFDIPADQLLGLPNPFDDADLARARRHQGVQILAAMRRNWPDLPVILMTARRDTLLERAADRHNAEEYTYFLDDEDLDGRSLRAQVAGILAARRGAERDGPIYWGRSLEMRRVRQRLGVLARGRLPVILTGPTGTGKSLIARHFVHARSGRKGKFVAVDLSTLPRELVASHLFGSVRGAYTGSVADRRGAFEEADGGTLFLDEIGNLGEDVQRMLLTVLQEAAVRRLGDTRERKVDVKLVVATNEDLGELVANGRFRRDLYMRLNPAATVELPPLGDRHVDLERLLEFCVEQTAAQPYVQELVGEYLDRTKAGREQGRSGMNRSSYRVRVVAGQRRLPAPMNGAVVLLFPEPTLRLLRRHRWPGNLREFAMAVENALTLALAEAIEAGRPSREDSGAEGAVADGSDPGRLDVVQVRPKLVRDLLRTAAVDDEEDATGWKVQVSVRPHEGLNKVAQDVERQYFTRLYLEEKGDFAGMARVLLGDPEAARKVQLRFNQLGLKVRELKNRIT